MHVGSTYILISIADMMNYNRIGDRAVIQLAKNKIGLGDSYTFDIFSRFILNWSVPGSGSTEGLNELIERHTTHHTKSIAKKFSSSHCKNLINFNYLRL